MTTLASYADQRDEMNQALAAQAPAELLGGFAAAAGRLDLIDFAGRAPAVGDQAPGFTLPDHSGKPIELAALLRQGPAVLIAYRGQWCPYCNLQLRTFQARLAEFEEQGARVVAVSPQTPDHSLSIAEANSLGFDVLSDDGAVVLSEYGLTYPVDDDLRALMESSGTDLNLYNGETGWVLPAVATFVIDQDGVVRYANVRGNWTERAEPSEVLAVLQGLDSLVQS
jgi:peroxiredoxin